MKILLILGGMVSCGITMFASIIYALSLTDARLSLWPWIVDTAPSVAASAFLVNAGTLILLAHMNNKDKEKLS